MKRHESLAPLSRDHHASLLLAQLLKKGAPAYRGLPSRPEEKAAYACKLFHADIKTHFNKEEQVLATLQGVEENIDKLAAEIIREHAALTAAFLYLESGAWSEEDLDALGRELELHIRKEERLLFPLIERHCNPKQLQELKLLVN